MADTQHSGGIGFLGLLAILFIGLKLTHFIDWSWLWVLAPIWIPIGLAIAFLVVAAIIVGAAWLVANRKRR